MRNPNPPLPGHPQATYLETVLRAADALDAQGLHAHLSNLFVGYCAGQMRSYLSMHQLLQLVRTLDVLVEFEVYGAVDAICGLIESCTVVDRLHKEERASSVLSFQKLLSTCLSRPGGEATRRTLQTIGRLLDLGIDALCIVNKRR